MPEAGRGGEVAFHLRDAHLVWLSHACRSNLDRRVDLAAGRLATAPPALALQRLPGSSTIVARAPPERRRSGLDSGSPRTSPRARCHSASRRVCILPWTTRRRLRHEQQPGSRQPLYQLLRPRTASVASAGPRRPVFELRTEAWPLVSALAFAPDGRLELAFKQPRRLAQALRLVPLAIRAVWRRREWR